MIRAYFSFEQIEALILDQRYYLHSSTTSSSSGSRSTTRVYKKPLIAVQYNTSGHQVISSGPASFQFFRDHKLGETVPCWYDPKNPEHFILSREISLLTLLGIFISASGSIALGSVALL